MLDTDFNHPAEWRIIEGHSFLSLHSEHAYIIVPEYQSYYLVCRIRCLYHNFTLFLPLPCSSANLFHQLKTSFMCPEIRIVQKVISI